MSWLLLILAIAGFYTSCWAWGSIQWDRGHYIGWQGGLKSGGDAGLDRDPITGRFVKRGGK